MFHEFTTNDTLTKRCPRCKNTKPLDAFPIDRRSRDGHNCHCKVCRKEMKQIYMNRPEATERTRAHDKKRRVKRKLDSGYRENQLAWHKKNPLAKKAYTQLHKAIHKGVISKASKCICVKCGKNAQHYHHHNGYSEGHELDVVALCCSCHRTIHDLLPGRSPSSVGRGIGVAGTLWVQPNPCPPL